MNRIPIILDMDGDGDNLIALAYALRSPALEVLGVTTVHGFAPVEAAEAAATGLLHELGVHVPVAMGAEKPLERERMPEALPSGEPGPAPEGLEPLPAWDWMAGALSASAEPVTVCLLGPATNLALLLHKYPALAGKIRRILFAGGSYAFGTVTASACHKVYFDAEAMQRIMHLGVPFYMASVDVTSGFTDGVDTAAFAAARRGKAAEAVQKYLPAPVSANRWLRTPLALVSLTHPGLFRFDRYKCQVELHGRITYGMTVVYKDNFDGVFELPDGTLNRRDVAEEDKNVWYMDAFDRVRALDILARALDGGAVKEGEA